MFKYTGAVCNIKKLSISCYSLFKATLITKWVQSSPIEAGCYCYWGIAHETLIIVTDSISDTALDHHLTTYLPLSYAEPPDYLPMHNHSGRVISAEGIANLHDLFLFIFDPLFSLILLNDTILTVFFHCSSAEILLQNQAWHCLLTPYSFQTPHAKFCNCQ